MRSSFCLLTALILVAVCRAQPPCTPPNRAFDAGEVLRYRVVYNWGPVWLESAFARFSVDRATLGARACYYLRGEGSTHKSYDWFFKVRDRFETWIDTATLRPLKFSAVMREGSKHQQHTYLFDDRRQRAFTIITRGKKPVETDTVTQGRCTIDVLSAIYHARSFDYSACAVNDTIGMSLLLDGTVYPIYVRYLGRDTFKHDSLGVLRCITFSPLLVEGTIFKAGEGMKVWVTDDRNRLPVYIETPIVVGTIRVTLVSFGGLRFPLEAMD